MSAAQTSPRRRPRKRKFSDPGRTWAKTLERYRPGLVPFVLDELAGLYGRPVWQRRLDPTSELILTILTQNSADTNAEVAFEALRATYPGAGEAQAHNPGAGWGGEGLPDGVAPDWAAIEFAPLPELVDTIRPGGLANQKAPRLQATLRRIREERGDYSLEFLGDMSALEARDWLVSIDGIGKKTASVLLLFSFGLPLMPVDRHVERVAAAGRARRRPRPPPTTPTTCSWACSSPTRCTRRTSTSSSTAGRSATPSAPITPPARCVPRCRFVDPKAP